MVINYIFKVILSEHFKVVFSEESTNGQILTHNVQFHFNCSEHFIPINNGVLDVQ